MEISAGSGHRAVYEVVVQLSDLCLQVEHVRETVRQLSGWTSRWQDEVGWQDRWADVSVAGDVVGRVHGGIVDAMVEVDVAYARAVLAWVRGSVAAVLALQHDAPPQRSAVLWVAQRDLELPLADLLREVDELDLAQLSLLDGDEGWIDRATRAHRAACESLRLVLSLEEITARTSLPAAIDTGLPVVLDLCDTLMKLAEALRFVLRTAAESSPVSP